MSMTALLKAVRNHLRTQLTLANDRCEVRPEGRPIGAVGEYYYGIDSGGKDSTAMEYLSESYRVNIWVTVRTGQYPTDRHGNIYLDSLEAKCRAAAFQIHGSYTVMAAANTLITGSVNKFQSPLYFEGEDEPQYRGAEWCGGTDDRDNFLVARLRFGGARRVQALDIMT